MAKKFLVSPGRCYVVTGPVGTTITAKDGTIVNSIVTGSTQCSFIPSVNEVTVDPDTAKLEQVSRGIAVRSSNNGGGGGGGSTGNDWITVNDAGEAVLNFPENVDSFSKITGTLGGRQNCSQLLSHLNDLKYVDLYLPLATATEEICNESTRLEYVKLIAPKTNTLRYAFGGCVSLQTSEISAENSECIYALYTRCKSLKTSTIDFPNASDCAYVFNLNDSLKTATMILPKATILFSSLHGCFALTSLSLNFSSMSTLDFTSTSGNGGLGNVTTLENVTVLDGGLASCTSFIITNSTNLTDASIQNIIDALPDYSGTETSALVSFPPGRLTTAQQTQLSNKGWTWS